MTAVRHLLRDDDLTPAEQAEVLALAARLKAAPHDIRPLAGPRTVAMLFDRATLRTQTSFAAGVAELGGFPLTVDGVLAGIGVRESVADTARVLGRQAAAIVWRTARQADLEVMAEHAGVPVVNGLTDAFHPCQLLADLLTLQEHLAGRGGSPTGDLAGVEVTFLGDAACNMGSSWALAGATAGMHLRACAPAGHEPDPAVVERAREIGATTGGTVTLERDPVAAVAGARVVVTDTWVSMGREDQAEARLAALAPYALTSELLDHAASDAVVLHCLPAHRGQEIAADVIDGPRSLVWDEAENRRHVQKAVLTFLLRRAGLSAEPAAEPVAGTAAGPGAALAEVVP